MEGSGTTSSATRADDPAGARGAKGLAIADWLLSHAAAMLALGAVVLYGLGVVTSIGELRATDLDVARGLALVPLEDHLRNGIGILASPWSILIVGVYVLMYFSSGATFAASEKSQAERERTTKPPQPSEGRAADTDGYSKDDSHDDNQLDSEETSPTRLIDRLNARWTWLERNIWPCIVGLLLLLTALVSPWPIVLVTLVIVAGWLLQALIMALRGPWSRRPAALYIAINAVSLVLVAAGDAYYRADPLPYGEVVTANRRVAGPVISSDRGVLYLAPTDGKGLYTGVAVDEIRELKVRKQERAEERSLLDFISDIL